jgi:cyanophycin synthetase
MQCVECGANPVHHRSAWVFGSIDAAFNRVPFPKFIFALYAKTSRPAQLLFTKGFKMIGPALIRTGVLAYEDDVEKAATARSRAMWEEARRRGLSLKQLVVLGTHTELFEFEKRGRPYIFFSVPIPPHMQNKELWPDDKFLVKKVFRQAGIPTPRSYSVSTFAEAKKILKELSRVCVKPRIGSNGRHTYTHITTEDQLRDVFTSAKKLCHWVIVEEHLEGNLGRATCVNGKLVGFLESQSPIVEGDGRSTVRQLVEAANASRPDGVSEIEITSLHETHIKRRGYTLDMVLEKGTKLPLINWAGYSSGGRNWEHGTDIHPELKSELERAARVTGLPLVGFDLILESPKKGPREQKWGIIEANSLPWIDLHQAALYGPKINVASHVWDLWN